MSQALTPTNLIGNGIATLGDRQVGTGAHDERLQAALSGDFAKAKI